MRARGSRDDAKHIARRKTASRSVGVIPDGADRNMRQGIPDDAVRTEPQETRVGLDWKIDAYLDGCWGITRLRLTTDAAAEKVATALVRPSKLSERAYSQMFSDIRQISIGLLLELVSRSRTGFRKNITAPEIGILSAQMELCAFSILGEFFPYT